MCSLKKEDTNTKCLLVTCVDLGENFRCRDLYNTNKGIMEIVASFHFISGLIGFYLDFVCFPSPYSIALHSAMHNDKYPPWASLVHIGRGSLHPYLEDNRSVTFIYTNKWRDMIGLFNHCKTPILYGAWWTSKVIFII